MITEAVYQLSHSASQRRKPDITPTPSELSVSCQLPAYVINQVGPRQSQALCLPVVKAMPMAPINLLGVGFKRTVGQISLAAGVAEISSCMMIQAVAFCIGRDEGTWEIETGRD